MLLLLLSKGMIERSDVAAQSKLTKDPMISDSSTAQQLMLDMELENRNPKPVKEECLSSYYQTKMWHSFFTKQRCETSICIWPRRVFYCLVCVISFFVCVTFCAVNAPSMHFWWMQIKKLHKVWIKIITQTSMGCIKRLIVVHLW